MNSAFSGLRIIFLLSIFYSSQAGEICVFLKKLDLSDRLTLISKAPQNIAITQGKIVVSFEKFMHLTSVPFTADTDTFSYLREIWLNGSITIKMFQANNLDNKPRSSIEASFLGNLVVEEVANSKPYQIKASINLNKGELISSTNKKYNISARCGTLDKSKDILYVGKVDIAIGQEYTLLRDTIVDKKVKVTNMIPLFLEFGDQDPTYTLIVIADSI